MGVPTNLSASTTIEQNTFQSDFGDNDQDVSHAVDNDNDGKKDDYGVDTDHTSDSDASGDVENGTTGERSGPASIQTPSSLKWELKIEKFKEIVSVVTTFFDACGLRISSNACVRVCARMCMCVRVFIDMKVDIFTRSICDMHMVSCWNPFVHVEIRLF